MKPAILAFFLGLAGMAHADGEKSGEFDYWVMALSWSPNWCAIEGDARKSPQCDPRENFGWTLHGLWPQYHRGWPAFCPTVERFGKRWDYWHRISSISRGLAALYEPPSRPA